MVKRIFGINIAVTDLEAAVRRYGAVFDAAAEPMAEDAFAFPGLVGARMNVGGTRITLIASTRKDTPVAQFLARRGEGVFLVAAEVEDIDAEVAALAEKDITTLLGEPARGLWGAVDFIHPKDMHGVQWEIYEPADEETGK